MLVAFDRPRGYRECYRQWDEGHTPPHVIFEVLDGERPPSKFAFCERHGVEEFYVYDPECATLNGYLRGHDGRLVPLPSTAGFTSPRLGVRFDIEDELVVTRPDGVRFLTYPELVEFYRCSEPNASQRIVNMLSCSLRQTIAGRRSTPRRTGSAPNFARPASTRTPPDPTSPGDRA